MKNVLFILMMSSLLFLSSCNEPSKKSRVKTFPWSQDRQEAFANQEIDSVPLVILEF